MRYDTKTKKDPLGNIEYGSLASEEIFAFLPNQSSPTPFVMETAGITYPDKNYFIQRKHSDYFIMEFITEGKGFLVSNGRSFELKAGDVCILELGDAHHYGADKKNPYTKLWFNFFSDVFGSVLESYGMSGKHVIHCPKSRIYFEEIIKLSESMRFSDEIAIELSLIVFKILTELALAIKQLEVKSALSKELKIHLDASIHDNVNIELLAKQLQISKMHLINEFKKSFGETPYNYILNKKIEMAKKLLKFTTLRINEIAANLKFNDGHHFSNTFKKKVGLSPLEFRHS